MNRPVVLIVGAVAGALILAAVGASAHTGLFGSNSVGVQSALSNDESSGARTETPEPSETPETEPADTDTDENDDSQGDNDKQGQSATGSAEHESGGTATTGGGKNDD